MSETSHISVIDAVELIKTTLQASEVSEAVAQSVADALVAAEAEGQVGHGFSRLGDYVAQVRSGKINAKADIKVTTTQPASLLIDADFGFAFPAMDAAIAQGVPAAKEQGIAIMAITNSHHCGALSVQVEKIADAGLMGMMFANSPKAMAPWGAKTPIFGTNPIAFSVPRAGHDPLVIDLSLSRVARGKVMNAHKSGKDIPEGWALDVDGNPTTNAKAALEGTMLPIGGAKGSALALMVEVLTTMFTGAAASHEASSFFAAEGSAPRVGQTLIAIRPHDGVQFAARLEALFTMISDMDGTRLPGDRRLAARAEAHKNGLAVPTHYLTQARALAGLD